MSGVPLRGARVLDLSTGVAGPYCAKLLASLGADVIKVEPPQGDDSRRMAPFARPDADLEGSALFLYLNTNKRGVVLDLRDKTDKARLRELAKAADIVIESFVRGEMEGLGVGYRALERLNPRLVFTSVTIFGQTGPYRDWRATELTLNALSGMMLLTGDPAREPVRLGLNQVQYTAGVSAAVATLAAYRYASATGRGQQVDVALVDPMLNGVHQQLARYSYWGALPTRSWWGYPPPLFETADGWIFAPQARDPVDMVAIMGYPEEVLQERFLEPERRQENAAEYRAIVERWMREQRTLDLCDRAQTAGMTWAPIHAEPDLIDCPQLAARSFLSEVTHPAAGKAMYPSRFFVSAQIDLPRLERAPLLDEHRAEIAAKGWGIFGGDSSETPRGRPSRDGVPTRPLEGIRILTPEHWAALPQATKHLASFGAEVITVQPVSRPHGAGGGGLYNECNRSKKVAALDLSRPEGADIFKRLVRISDIVADNFTPRVMKNFGLDYEALRAVKPDIIVLSLSGYGHLGPRNLWRGHTVTAEATSGLMNFTGYRDGGPVRPGATPYGDIVTGAHAALALLAALEHRGRTGEGAFIDLSMIEPCASELGEAIVSYSSTGLRIARIGNRDLNSAPAGCYRCAGEDRWVAIEAADDAQWRRLVALMERPDLAESLSFSSLDGRRARHDEIDAAIEAWTSRRDSIEVMRACQAAGVAAGAVYNVREVMTDPQLLHRGAFDVVQHIEPPAGSGRQLHLAAPWRLSLTPVTNAAPAPQVFGQDNDYVYRDLLGMSDDEVAALVREGVIAYEPPQRPPEPTGVRRDQFKIESDHRRLLGLE